MRKVLNNKVLLFVVAILVLSNIGIVFYFLTLRDAGKRNNSRWERQKSPITEFLEKDIGFSAAQMSEFDKTRQKHRQLMRPLFEDIKAAKVQFYSMLTNPSVTDSALNAAAGLIGEKQKKLDLQTFRNFKEVRTLCTPGQQPKYDSLIVNEISNMWFPSWKGNGRQQKDSSRADH